MINLDGWEDAVETFYEKRGGVGFKPMWDDLGHLADCLKETEPKSILEYGSGCSTALFFHYAKLNDAVVLAYDADPDWFRANRRALPGNKLSKIIFNTIESYGPFGFRFSFRPLDTADFVYVDGPELIVPQVVGYDVMELSPLPNMYVVDGRTNQVVAMNTMLGNLYNIEIVYEDGGEVMRATFRKKL